MTKNAKTILIKIRKLQKLLLKERYQFKLKPVHSKRPTTNVAKIKWMNYQRKVKGMGRVKFRKRAKGEKRSTYNIAQKAFYDARKPKMRKYINITLNYLRSTFKNKELNKILGLRTNKRTYRKPFNVKRLRKWKIKKLYSRRGSTVYIRSIKRWTGIKQGSAKRFLSRLNTRPFEDTVNNQYHYADILQTYKLARGTRGTDFEKSTRKIKLNLKQKRKYKNLKALRIQLLSKVAYKTLLPPGKFNKPNKNLTTKQKWLVNRYVWLKRKTARKRKYKVDFFKTVLGTQFLIAHKSSRNALMRGRRYRNALPKRVLQALQYFTLSKRNWARKFQGEQKRAWFYTNLVLPKKLPYYFQRKSAATEYPFNKFKEGWRTRTRTPWLHSLISKRVLYSGFLTSERRELKWTQKFSWIPFLRNKRPVFEKKNKLYFHRKRLLRNRNNRYVVRTKKKARIKQVLQRTTLPFYGHLRAKQFNRIKEKARAKKSTLLSREDIQLGSLERRLDVVVYRLNLAPNIFWARKLIQDGSIFVSSSSKMAPAGQTKEFEKMYAHYKQNAYPLKLRDPQSLYKKTPWNNSFTKGFKIPVGKDFVVDGKSVVRRDSLPEGDQAYKLISTKLKFLLEPLRNINYLTSPGDVILCAPGALNSQYKSNKVLWQKPVPTHLLAYSNLTEVKTKFKPRSNELGTFARQDDKTTNVGVVIFSPTFSDLHRRDRIQRSFLRWMSL